MMMCNGPSSKEPVNTYNSRKLFAGLQMDERLWLKREGFRTILHNKLIQQDSRERLQM